MSPYHHGDRVQVAFLDDVLPHCDLYLAITGRYWFERVAASPFAHWAPMMRHLDLAVDRDDFPVTKRTFAPPGLRRVVYIGHSGWTKNPGYLSAIAAAAPEIAIGWVGGGKAGIPGLRPLGYHDFATDAGRASVAGYDFMLTVGRADANPTTILEAMAWGLIPVCTPESGYAGYPGIVNVPMDRPEEAAGVLRALQEMPDARLRAMQADNWAMLDRHFNWDRFARDVVAAVESGEAPGTTPVSRTHRWALRASAYGAPSAPWRPGQLRGAVRSVLDVVRRRATSARARSTL